MKDIYQLKSRDLAIARLIQRAMVDLPASEITLPPLPAKDDEFKRIVLNLHEDQVSYIDDLARTLRGVAGSVALEAVILQVRDLRPVHQLNLNMEDAVSG